MDIVSTRTMISKAERVVKKNPPFYPEKGGSFENRNDSFYITRYVLYLLLFLPDFPVESADAQDYGQEE